MPKHSLKMTGDSWRLRQNLPFTIDITEVFLIFECFQDILYMLSIPSTMFYAMYIDMHYLSNDQVSIVSLQEKSS